MIGVTMQLLFMTVKMYLEGKIDWHDNHNEFHENQPYNICNIDVHVWIWGQKKQAFAKPEDFSTRK
jgi:hypothetical protein